MAVAGAGGGGCEASGGTEVIILISDSGSDEDRLERDPCAPVIKLEKSENGHDRDSPSLLQNGHKLPIVPVIKPELPQADKLYNRTHYKVSPMLQEMTEKANCALTKFLELCTPLMSRDDRGVILKRVDVLVQQTNLHYLASEQFRGLVADLTRKVGADGANVYVHLKTLTDELRAYREKRPKPKGTTAPSASTSGDAAADRSGGAAANETTTDNGGTTSANGEEVAEDSGTAASNEGDVKDLKRQKQIRQLEKHLRKLHRAIKKLRKKEVDWDSEDDINSPYIMEDRYKKKFVKVWWKLCELQGRRPLTGREDEKKFRYSGSRYPEINEGVCRMINSKKIFPDFTDILGLIKSHNELSSLGLQGPQMEQIAKEVFTDVGQELQARRKREELRLALLYLEDEEEVPKDPAEADPELRARLDENGKLFSSRMDEVVQSFVNRQLEQKLEPREVQEEDCDQSPPPSPKNEATEDEDEEEEEEEEDEDLVNFQDLSGDENSPEEDEEKDEKAEDPDALIGKADDKAVPPPTQPCAGVVASCPEEAKPKVEAEVIVIVSDDEALPPAKRART
ncbi:death domain-associated protein 6 isoform X1 [Ixodes scapularis]|uniref:death domain-associated protein 6 isoform X1 n=1 Tax=Ixodes scapularis TaxID=6945 RepID=UPI001A9D78C7|nr:death domain-associated protein 6 isoform X1 [Ixodes scapularis]